MTKKYREKPCNEVEAFQWDGENIDIAHYFIEKQYHHEVSVICGHLWIKNSKNAVIAKKGDYIVKGVDGEFYVCEQDVFEKVYEEVKEFELANELKKANAKVDALEKRISDMNHNSEIGNVLEHKYETTLRFYKESQDRNDARRYYFSMLGLYERLAKGGIECTITLDDKNGICTIYSYGVELEDNSERVNKLFEDVLEEEENDQ